MSDDKRSGGSGRKPPHGRRPPSGGGPKGDKPRFGGGPKGDKPRFGGRSRDEDGPRRPFRERGEGRPASRSDDRPARSFRDRQEGGEERPRRSFRDRAEGREERPWQGDRPRRDEGERPRRPFRDRPSGDEDRPRRSFRDRTEGREERPWQGDRPRRDDGERPHRPFRDRPAGDEDRPRRSFRDRQEGRDERPRREDGERPRRSFRDRPEGGGEERPHRPWRERQERPIREEAERPRRPFRDRPEAGEDRRPMRRIERDGSGGGERPFRAFRGEGGGERPYRARRPDDAPARREATRGYRSRDFEVRDEDRPRRDAFEPRFDERRERGAPKRPGERRQDDRKSEGRRFEGRKPDDRKFEGRKFEGRKFEKRDGGKPRPAEGQEGSFEGERVAKVIARVGLGSRRDVEAWIEAGRVAVNGEVLESAARNVTAQDSITVDGKPLPKRERTRLWLYHKPRGLVTTEKDPEGRPTVFQNLPAGLPRVMSIGRLDINTEGLLLLTNDGGLARVLELPKTGWLRRYRVRAFGETDQAKLDGLFEGLTIDGVDYGAIEARLDKEQGANAWLTLGLREGKNREVKNVLASIGLEVNRLIRVSYGPFQLGDLSEGAVEEVSTRVLADQLGAALVEEAGCEFDAPVFERPAEPPRTEEKGSRRRGLRVKSEEGEADRVMRGGLIEDRRGRRVLVQRVADEAGKDPAHERPKKPFRPKRPPSDGDSPPRRPRGPGRGPRRDEG